jgi:hypothetical protein
VQAQEEGSRRWEGRITGAPRLVTECDGFIAQRGAMCGVFGNVTLDRAIC